MSRMMFVDGDANHATMQAVNGKSDALKGTQKSTF